MALTTGAQAKKELIANAIGQVRRFRFCGPSDDPDEQTAVTVGFRHLIIQLKRLAGPLLPEDAASRLNAINVEVNDLYSAYDANAELEALLPDIESALEPAVETTESQAKGSAVKPLPIPVCSIVGDVLGTIIYHHRTLETLFYEAGAVGEVPQGNCVTKCQTWLKRMHTEVADPTAVLGKVLEEFMEVDRLGDDRQEAARQRITDALARFGLSYHQGGLILGAVNALPTKSLKQVLKDRDLAGVDREFERALANVETDPPAAITAACSILESLFKVYIEDTDGLEMPSDQSLKPLWRTASKHLGLDPGTIEDDDVKKVLSGLNSVVDGIGALRTHVGSAHGRGRRAYRLQSRHARLAIHASHTLVGFFIETWDERKRKAPP
jgi:Abortive infection C-terminus